MCLRSWVFLLSVLTHNPLPVEPVSKENTLAIITRMILTTVDTFTSMTTLDTSRCGGDWRVSFRITFSASSMLGVLSPSMRLPTIRAPKKLSTTGIGRMTPPEAPLTQGNARSGGSTPNIRNRVLELHSTVDHSLSPSTRDSIPDIKVDCSSGSGLRVTNNLERTAQEKLVSKGRCPEKILNLISCSTSSPLRKEGNIDKLQIRS